MRVALRARMRTFIITASIALVFHAHAVEAQPVDALPPPEEGPPTDASPPAPPSDEPPPAAPPPEAPSDQPVTPERLPAPAPEPPPAVTEGPVPPRPGSAASEPTAPPRMGLTADAEVGPTRRPGARRHDGFYFRLATGFSAYAEGLQSDDTELYGGEVEARLRGFAVSSEFALGGTVSPGVVLGGGIYSDDVIVSRLDVSKGDGLPAEVDPPSRNLTLYAPFVDWYFDPNKGFHFQLAIGFAQLHGVDLAGVDWDDHVYHANGIGIMLGLGHEWWISDNWGVGVLGRLSVSVLFGEDDADVDWTQVTSSVPGFLLTLTHH